MRNNRSNAHLLTAFILMSACLFAPIPTSGNWGMEVGRANEGDQVRLLSDWTAMKMAENRIKNALLRVLQKERQQQLLRLSAGDGSTAAELLDGVYFWFMKEVLTPAQRIGMNPAASCKPRNYADYDAYFFRAKRGQTLSFKLTTTDSNAYVMVYETQQELGPDEDMISVGEEYPRIWSGKLPVTSEYSVQIYGVRSSGQHANRAAYTIEIAIRQ